ncbi:hypothetical protein [Xanthomonas arboricola]|nr:hypothetical protein [Xanthomonas arboricola]
MSAGASAIFEQRRHADTVVIRLVMSLSDLQDTGASLTRSHIERPLSQL